LGYYLPMMWLSSKASRRQQSILKSLPDALDLLTICVEAGLGFDSAMGKVVEKWDDDLSDAFGRVLQEIQLGKLRREALRDMANRMDVSDVSTFVAAIVQHAAASAGRRIGSFSRYQDDAGDCLFDLPCHFHRLAGTGSSPNDDTAESPHGGRRGRWSALSRVDTC